MQIDRNLIEGCKEKKRAAQNELYKQVFSFLMNICIRYKKDYELAGASLNGIFLKILNHLDEVKEISAFPAWIKRIAINHLIDEYRKEKRLKANTVYLEDHSSLHKINAEGHKSDQELDSEYLKDLIKKLPPVTEQVFNLFAIDGFKHREISELLDISENTSKWHVREARLKLQAELEKFQKLHEI